MVSGPAQTAASRLRLIQGQADVGAGQISVVLQPTERLKKFLASSAAAGVSDVDAVELAIERALVLADARALGLNAERASRLLGEAAARTRPHRTIGPQRSTTARRLAIRQPRRPTELDEAICVPVASHLATRAADQISGRAFAPGAIEEMVAWGRAAALEGRTMTEWGLRVLAGRLAAA